MESPRNYVEALQLLPHEFYFPDDTMLKIKETYQSKLQLRGTRLPLYNPSIVLPGHSRKEQDDYFRSPVGPHIYYLMNIGYGAEVELPSDSIQEVWNPRTKSSFFLDHLKEQITSTNPRMLPQAKSASIKMHEIVYGDQQRQSFPHTIATRPTIIEQTAKRAHSKPHGCIIYACGVNGRAGAAGYNGTDGQTGIDGANAGFLTTFLLGGGNGKPGRPGQNGSVGGDGGRAVDGTRASDVVISLDGKPENLTVVGSSKFTCNLGGFLNEHVLLINCRGGNGGTGGCGGNGGHGGNGGSGGKGGDGNNASNAGQNGGNGGNGGDGGDSGNGGSGGMGGDGGCAGQGGTCIVQSADSSLFMLVEIDCSSGTSGIGGKGGKAGEGGQGGTGGRGGRGGRGGSGGHGVEVTDRSGYRHTTTLPGIAGAPGQHGAMGRNGRNGLGGQKGRDGEPAIHGNVQWVHYSVHDSTIISKSDQRYEAEVIGYKVRSSNNDGIFEPNEQIIISELQILNSGGMPIPEGATVFFPKAKGVNFLPIKYMLPGGLAPTMKYIVPQTFKGRISDQPSPNNPGPFSSSVQFCSRIEILGRPFEKSFHFKKMEIQYPVKIVYSRSSESLERGEVSSINIGVKNISTLPYGKSVKSACGSVILQLHFDRRIIPIGSAQVEIINVPYEVYNTTEIPDSTFIEIQEILPGSTVNVQVTIQMDIQAELFDKCMWQADLILRGKLIQYSQTNIRVSPTYIIQQPQADILFITSQSITRKQFTFWQALFKTLQVSVDYWDIDKHSGLSVDSRTNTEHPKTWKGRYSGSMILYPYCNLQNLQSIDLVKHFNGSTTAPAELNSSAVLFMLQQNDHNKALLKYLSTATNSIPGITYGGKHMLKPDLQKNPKIYSKYEKQMIKTLEKENPSQLPILAGRQLNVQSTGTFKYSYGSVNIRRIPLLHSAKFLVVADHSSSVDIGVDDPQLSLQSTNVPLASIFGQLFFSVLFGLNISAKMKLMKDGKYGDIGLRFSLPNGSIMFLPEITIVWEIADEVYNFSGTSYRMQAFTNDVKGRNSEYLVNGTIVLRGLLLLKNELKKRKEKLRKLCNSKTAQACSEIIQLCSQIEQLLTQSGISKKNLEPLPIIDILTDSSHFFLPHQLVQKDKKWDLTS